MTEKVTHRFFAEPVSAHFVAREVYGIIDKVDDEKLSPWDQTSGEGAEGGAVRV